MKRKTAALILISLSVLLLFSCTYNVIDTPNKEYPEISITPDNEIFRKADLDMVSIKGLTPLSNITASNALMSIPHYFTRFFKDGFIGEICKQIGVKLPDVTMRPTRAISASFNIDAADEVLSIGTPYKNWSEVYLDRMAIRATGNTSNLVGLILHHIDPMEWPVNEPATGTIELYIRAGIRNGSDKPDEPMPKAYISTGITLILKDVIFDTIEINGIHIPFPVQGKLCIGNMDLSMASSHITYRDDINSEFPSVDENITYSTGYLPFAIDLHAEPTLLFNVENVIQAMQKIIKDNDNAAPYWSYIVNSCWEKYAGNHITLEARTGNGEDNIKDELKVADLNMIQSILLGIR